MDEEPGRLPSMGSQKSQTTQLLNNSNNTMTKALSTVTAPFIDGKTRHKEIQHPVQGDS